MSKCGSGMHRDKALPEDGGHGYQIKGDGLLTFHLGCDYIRVKDGTLRAEPKKYIAKMLESYERMYKEKLKYYNSPLEKGDHPELDNSPLLLIFLNQMLID